MRLARFSAASTIAAGFVLALLCMGRAVFCANGFQDENASAPVPTVTVATAPPETREVVAEGRAAVGVGGIIAARKAAEAQALRNAVEKTLGVFVSARTLTQNYILVRDTVSTHASGYATLQSVLRETVSLDGREVTATIRALVSLRPLAEQLKASRLTRAWRVFVPKGGPSAQSARTQTESALEQAGFVVVSSTRDADLLVEITPEWQTASKTPLDTAAGLMTMHGVRAQVSLRATRKGTGEVVAALSAPATRLHVSEETARQEAAETAARALSPRLVDALLLLPARDFSTIALQVKNLNGAARMAKLEDALQTLPGVRSVLRRSYQKGAGTWELDISTETAPLLTRTLEEAGPFKPFHLTVFEESRAKIVASAGTAPFQNQRQQRTARK